MANYHTLGKIPHKRHTQFRDANGKLYSEQLFSTEGFSSNYSLLYHIHPPTEIIRVEEPTDVRPEKASKVLLKHRSFDGYGVKPKKDYLDSRTCVLFNDDCHMSLAAPKESMKDYFYKNADADEVIFIHEGKGKVKTQYGDLP